MRRGTRRTSIPSTSCSCAKSVNRRSTVAVRGSFVKSSRYDVRMQYAVCGSQNDPRSTAATMRAETESSPWVQRVAGADTRTSRGGLCNATVPVNDPAADAAVDAADAAELDASARGSAGRHVSFAAVSRSAGATGLEGGSGEEVGEGGEEEGGEEEEAKSALCDRRWRPSAPSKPRGLVGWTPVIAATGAAVADSETDDASFSDAAMRSKTGMRDDALSRHTTSRGAL